MAFEMQLIHINDPRGKDAFFSLAVLSITPAIDPHPQGVKFSGKACKLSLPIQEEKVLEN